MKPCVIQVHRGFFYDKKDRPHKNGLYNPMITKHIQFANNYRSEYQLEKDIWVCKMLQWKPRVIEYKRTPNYL